MSFLIPFVSLIIGIIPGWFSGNPYFALLPLGGALIFYLLLLKKSQDPVHALNLNKYHHLWIFLLFVGIGWLDAAFNAPAHLDSKSLSKIKAMEGMVAECSTFSSGDRIDLESVTLFDSLGNNYPLSNTKIRIYTDGYYARNGEKLFLPVSLSEIFSNKNYRDNGYIQSLKYKGILYSSKAYQTDISKVDNHKSLKYYTAATRDFLEIKLEKSSLSRNCRDFIIAMILGDRSFIDDEITDKFSVAGVTHILALSGTHVAIIMGIFLWLLYPLKFADHHKLRVWIAVILVWGYCFLTGLSPSTVRATLMVTFATIGTTSQRLKSSGNALLISVFIILLFQPAAIFDAGLQLSFLCVGSILTFVEYLNTIPHHAHPRLFKLNAFLLTSLVATAATWVVVSHYFGRIPLLFLPANMILLPLLPLFITLSLIYLIFLCFGLDLSILSSTLDFCYSIFRMVIDWVNSFPGSSISFRASLLEVALWLTGITLLGFVLHRKKSKTLVSLSIGFLLLIIVLSPFLSPLPSDSLILQTGSDEIAVRVYTGYNENLELLPKGTNTSYRRGDVELVLVDAPLSEGIKVKLMKPAQSTGLRRFLILGSRADLENLMKKEYLINFEKIIIHSSVKPAKAESFCRKASDIGLSDIHNLRKEPLEIYF